MRGLIVILSDVEKSTQLNELISLWNEIATNKYKYSLNQLWFANEKIRKRALIVSGEDIEKCKFYHVLKQMKQQNKT